MDKITIADLEVFYRVGISEQERAQPQRLLLTIELDYDLTSAAASDRLDQTINYHAVSRTLLKFGEGRTWNLIEKLAADIADLVLETYQPQSVRVEVKKFPFAQARYVAVTLSRTKRRG